MSQAFIVKPEVRRRQDGGELNPPLSSEYFTNDWFKTTSQVKVLQVVIIYAMM